jgi:hypothetical protein
VDLRSCLGKVGVKDLPDLSTCFWTHHFLPLVWMHCNQKREGAIYQWTPWQTQQTLFQTKSLRSFPPRLSWLLHLLSLRSCSIRSLSAHTLPHIHAAHIIFTITTQTIATELAFHSSKIVQRHATPTSNGSVTKSDNTSKNSTYLSKNFECIHTFAIALIC